MLQTFKVTNKILTQSAENARPVVVNCPIARALREKYKNARFSGQQVFFNNDKRMIDVTPDIIKYAHSFDKILSDNTWDEGELSEEAQEEVLALPEFEFEIDIPDDIIAN